MKTFIGPEGLQVEVKVDGKLEWRKAAVICRSTCSGGLINTGQFDIELKDGERLVELLGIDPIIVKGPHP